MVYSRDAASDEGRPALVEVETRDSRAIGSTLTGSQRAGRAPPLARGKWTEENFYLESL